MRTMRPLTTCEMTGTRIQHPTGTVARIVGSNPLGFVVEGIEPQAAAGRHFVLPYENVETWTVPDA